VLEPQHFWARWMLGGLLARQGRQAEALPHLMKCTELEPEFALAYGATSEALLPLGRAEEAVTWARRGATGLAGVICNSAGNDAFERSVLTEFAESLGTHLIGFVPRSPVIQACEVEGRTVLQHSPQASEADVFCTLAGRVLDNHERVIPMPIEEVTDLEALYRRHLGLRATEQAVQ